MARKPSLPSSNHLLDVLTSADRKHLLGGCETVDLAYAEVLYLPSDRLRDVYFPITAFISLIIPVDASGSLEVGLVGNEGMFGIPIALGVAVAPTRAVVQGAGISLRMTALRFGAELAENASLRGVMGRYVFVHLSNLAQTAGCMRFHVVQARLARWLLMTQDRAHASTFSVTQEFLSLMLGVRRVGVTEAAGALQDRGLIRYHRGTVEVLDRRGLKAASCGCYRADRQAYDRMLG